MTKTVILAGMAFAKAEQLLRLATLAASRRSGVTLDDVTAEFAGSLRTAQRMMRALENHFPETAASTDHEGRKRWRLPSGSLRDLLTLKPEEVAALELAEDALARTSGDVEAGHLRSLKHKILALVPRHQIARLETDQEALLEAQGLAARPGPRVRIDPQIAHAVAEAIKACRIIEIHYRSRGARRARWRKVAPYGILAGIRKYLVATDGRKNAQPVTYRFEAIGAARATKMTFQRPQDFDLGRFANRAFGSYHDESQYTEVVWRFSPKAATHALSFEFHPDQRTERRSDGSLIVRFKAAGYLEMCWHLYAWGNHVEVLAPEPLRLLCEAYRRSDFPALP